MPTFRTALSELGLELVQTVMQSGNAVFRAPGRTRPELEVSIREKLGDSLGLAVDCYVRDRDDWEEIIDGNPFSKEAKTDPSHLLVHFLHEAPDPASIFALQAAIAGPERLALGSQHVYISYPDGIGTSTIGRTPGWSNFTRSGTARNWNTILKARLLLNESTTVMP